MPISMRKRFECVEFGCKYAFESADEDEIVREVQKHISEEHDSFELDDIILANTIDLE